MADSPRVKVSVKDPDLLPELRQRGISAKGLKAIEAKSEFGEYFAFEIWFDPATGRVMGAHQIDIKR